MMMMMIMIMVMMMMVMITVFFIIMISSFIQMVFVILNVNMCNIFMAVWTIYGAMVYDV